MVPVTPTTVEAEKPRSLTEPSPEAKPQEPSQLERALAKDSSPVVVPDPKGQNGMLIRGLADLMAFAEIAHKSGLAPKGMGPAAIAIVVQTGMEIGLGPAVSLQTFYSANNGKVAAYGTGLMGLAARHPDWSGLSETIEGEGDERTATCTAHRKGCPDLTHKFSIKQAKAAGLFSRKDSPWSSYPDRMLASKPRGWAIRDQFADAIWGCITEDELNDYPQKGR